MTAFGGNLTGLTSDHPQVQEALSRVWRAPRALRLSDGTFAAFDHRGALLAVGLSAERWPSRSSFTSRSKSQAESASRCVTRNRCGRFSERGEPEIDLAELGL
jgi:hypothetical protein